MSSLKILLVEDKFLIALELEQILEDAGHEVCGIAATSADALRLASERKPQLAFVDIDLLDGPSGFDIVRAFANAGSPMAVFLTSNVTAPTTAFEYGAGLMAKPYRPGDIANAAAYFAQGIMTPPPTLIPPHTLQLSPLTQRRFASH